MDHSPHIHDLLTAFRPEVDNLADESWTPLRIALAADPALAREFHTQHQHDRIVHAAMHEVPLPVGLAERLLASLPHAAGVETAATNEIKIIEAPASGPVTIPPVVPAARTRRTSRRTFQFGLGIAISAAAVAVLVALWSPMQRDVQIVSAEELSRLVQQWDAHPELRDADAWHHLPSGSLSTHPLDRDVLVSAARSQHLPSESEDSVVVYELLRGGRKAHLYVVPTAREYLVSLSPCTPLNGLTGGLAAGAWQRDGFLYVLVYNDRDTSFQDFVRVPNFT